MFTMIAFDNKRYDFKITMEDFYITLIIKICLLNNKFLFFSVFLDHVRCDIFYPHAQICFLVSLTKSFISYYMKG